MPCQRKRLSTAFAGNVWLLTVLAFAGCANYSTPIAPISISPNIQQTLAYPPFLINPVRASNYRQLGLEHRDRGDYPAAIAALKIAAALDPQNLEGYVILGWTLHLAGYDALAGKFLRQALDWRPDHVPALNALGIVYLVEGNLSAAVATHTQAAALKPDNEIAYYNLSLAYQRLQQYSEAVVNAQKATELEPHNPHPWVALAIAYWGALEGSSAKAAYQTAIRLEPRYRDRTFLDHLNRAGFSPAQIETAEKILSAVVL